MITNSNADITPVAGSVSRLVITFAVGCLSFLGVSSFAAEFPADANVSLVLPDGMQLPWRDGQRKELELDLKLKDGVPRARVWGGAFDYNLSTHHGTVVSHSHGDGQLTVTVDMTINPDAYVPGFTGRWILNMQRDGEDGITGTWTAQMPVDHVDYDPIAVSGELVGRLGPLWPFELTDHQTPDKGVHPKLFFAKEDIVGLRAKAATEAGKEIVSQLKAQLAGAKSDYENNGYLAAGWALLWVLEGDKEQLAKARELAMEIQNYNAPQERYHGYPQAIAGLAVAYDFCAADWDDDFSEGVSIELRRWSRMLGLLRKPLYHTGGQGNHPLIKNLRADSVEMLHWRSACGLAALAVMGDPSHMPMQLAPEPIPDVQAPLAVDTSPKAGVVPFTAARKGIPGLWMFAGPMTAEQADAALAEAGGLEAWVAAPGAEFGPVHISKVAAAALGGKAGADAAPSYLNLLQPFARKWNTIGLFQSVIHVKRPRVVAFDFPYKGVQCSISGVEIDNDTTVRLQPGFHPLTMRFKAKRNPFGKMLIKPFIKEVDDPQVAYDAYVARREAWEAAGRTFQGLDYELEVHVRQVDKVLELATGVLGSSNGHSQWGLAWEKTFPFGIAARRVLGLDFAGESVFAKVVPWLVRTGLIDSRFGDRGYGGPGLLATGLPLCDPDWRPAVRTVLDHDHHGAVGSPWLSVFAFLHHDPELDPGPLPSTAALAVHDAKTANSSFRAGRDLDACVATMIGARLPVDSFGWQTVFQRAGELAILGFGTGPGSANPDMAWLAPNLPPVHSPFYTPASNTIRITGCIPVAGGTAVHFAGSEDGSGTATLAFERWRQGDRTATYRNYPFASVAKEGEDLPIRALRMLGVDYSGACGAPALFVVVDHVMGAEERAVTVPFSLGIPKVSVDGDSHRAMIAGPEGRSLQIALGGAGSLELPGDKGERVVRAHGAQTYITVMTLQDGEAPAVVFDGTGLDTSITVGGRAVRIVDERVVFGDG